MLVVGAGVVGAGHGPRRGLARALHRPRRAARLRQRHQQPLLEAGARRPALPGDVRLRAGQGGARGARAAAHPDRARTWSARCRSSTRCTTPGSGPTSAPAWCCTTAWRMEPGRQVRDGRAEAQAPVPQAARPDGARPAHRRADRRDPLLRLPGRRRPAGDEHRPHRRGVRRPRRLAHQGDRLPPRGRPGGRRTRAWTSRTTARSRCAPGSSSTPAACGPTRSRSMLGGRGALDVEASKGIHLVVPRDRIRSECGFITKTETSVLFVIPWGRHWIIGTTDTPWDLDLAHPAASRADIDYVLGHVNKLLRTPLDHDDVAGRVRRAAAAAQGRHRADLEDLPRAHRRHAGARTGDDRRRQADDLPGDGAGRRRRRGAVARARRGARESITERVPLLGASGFEARTNQRVALARASGLDIARIDHLLGRFGGLDRRGAHADRRSGPSWREPLTGAEDYLAAEVVYAVTHEGARHLDDVLTRRTRISIETFDRGTSVGPARRRADGRRARLGRTPASRTRSTTTCAASRPSGRARRSRPTRRPTRRGSGRPKGPGRSDGSRWCRRRGRVAP